MNISVKNNFIIILNVINVLDKKFLRGIQKDLDRKIRMTTFVIPLCEYRECAFCVIISDLPGKNIILFTLKTIH